MAAVTQAVSDNNSNAMDDGGSFEIRSYSLPVTNEGGAPGDVKKTKKKTTAGTRAQRSSNTGRVSTSSKSAGGGGGGGGAAALAGFATSALLAVLSGAAKKVFNRKKRQIVDKNNNNNNNDGNGSNDGKQHVDDEKLRAIKVELREAIAMLHRRRARWRSFRRPIGGWRRRWRP